MGNSMGFALGNRCLLRPSLHHSRSPSSSASQSVALCLRNGVNKRSLPVMACASNDVVSCKRRAILFVGISVLPLLQLRALALQGLASKESEVNTQQSSQISELALRSDAPQNPVVSLLNGFGWFSSGVLGALYALSMQEKKATDTTIELMKIKLKDKEDTIASLERSFESKLLNEQEERVRQINKATDEQQSLTNQLNSANATVSEFGQLLKSEKRLTADLKVELDGLNRNLAKAGEDKRALEETLKEKAGLIETLQGRIKSLNLELKEKEDSVLNLDTSLLEKELELRNVNSIYEQTKNELATAHAEVEILKHEMSRNETELESKVSLVDKLNLKVGSLTVERDDSKKKLDAVLEEYNDLKSTSDRKTALDGKLLEERELEIEQLKEKLDLELNEAREHQAIISDLTQQREDLSKTLDAETSKVNNLKHELQINQEILGKSRNECSDMAEQLRQSTNQCVALEAEVSKIITEFAEARDILERSASDSKLGSEVLAGELSEAKKLLKKTKDEVQILSLECAATAENRDNLQKELVDVYKKAESSSQDLKEEKKIVSCLKKELQSMEKQLTKDKEARKSLETDLEEATISLDEMNRNAMLLARDLEMTNARNSSLEAEKEILYKTLTEQNNASREAQENMEDAHNIAMRLGREREILEKKLKKRAEELASAKGEILRLRSKINSSRVAVNDNDLSLRNEEVEGTVAVIAGKRGRRRKIDGSE